MSRLEVPLVLQEVADYRRHRRVRGGTGPYDQDRSRSLGAIIPFLVDSGTEMTTMPVGEAKHQKTSRSRNGRSPDSHSRAWRSARGCSAVQIPGDGRDQVTAFFGHFLGDPNVRPPVRPRNLLGLTGVINQIRLTFDGTSSVVPPSGFWWSRKVAEFNTERGT